MKKSLFAALFSLCAIATCATAPFTVKRLPQWGGEYFTITNLHTLDIWYRMSSEILNIHIPEAGMEYFVPQKNKSYNCTVYACRSLITDIQYPELYYREPSNIKLLDVITEIDGQSTRGMSYSQFYELLADGADITLLRKEEGHHNQHKTRIETCQHPDFLTARGVYDILAQANNSNGLVTYSLQRQERNLIESNKQNGLTILKDNTYDWFNAVTYDFIVVGNDPLTDKELLSIYEKTFLTDLRRDSDNPDILISIAKSSDESVMSTYVPETETIVNTGSVTKPKYNYSGKFSRYETTNQYTTHRQGGYTKTTTDTDLFLEVVILDAAALRNNPSTPPIIYQATYNRHFTNRNNAIIDIYANVINNMTLLQPFRSHGSYEVKYCGFDIDEKNVITQVNPISMAYAQGLRQGDEVLKVERYTNNLIYDYDKGLIINTGKDYIVSKKYDIWTPKSDKSLHQYFSDKYYNYNDMFFEFKLSLNGVNTDRLNIPPTTYRYKFTIKRNNKKMKMTIECPLDFIRFDTFYIDE